VKNESVSTTGAAHMGLGNQMKQARRAHRAYIESRASKGAHEQFEIKSISAQEKQ